METTATMLIMYKPEHEGTGGEYMHIERVSKCLGSWLVEKGIAQPAVEEEL